MEDENTKAAKAAKAFMDMYFPVKKKPNPLKSDILDSLFPPPKNQQEEVWKNEGSADQSPNVQNSAPAGGNSQDSLSRSRDTHQKVSESVFIYASEPCYMSSSVDYGSRDDYPISKQHPGGDDIEKENKDGYDFPDPENYRGEWWENGNSRDSLSESQDTYQKASDFIDASSVDFMSSSVDYGCRDYYPISKQHPGGHDIMFCSEGNADQSPNVQNSAHAESASETSSNDPVASPSKLGGRNRTCAGRLIKQRILVVANRLPVSAARKGEDSWSLSNSAGGLVSALSGVKEVDAKWIGWAGVIVPDEKGRRSLTLALAEKRCVPVFLDEEIVQLYYNGYCNNILWPLFHYLGLPQEDRLSTTRSFQSQLDAYKRVNQMFADVVNEHYQEGDVVWCHDYHLMFLPKCLKEQNSSMKVGWFLHTPFPSSEIHRTLPCRSDLLRSVLAADLVGFHTYDYARHFVSSCTRILGLEGTPEGVEDQGKLTRVAAFPIGIDSERFKKALELPAVKVHIGELTERFAGRKVMLGVDRLDMIKGIPQKILAFEKFLEENPSWRDKVVLLQIAIPTRTGVPEYQKLTCQVHGIVGRVNGRFGTVTTVPIHHLDCSLEFSVLCALYAVTDVALVTSLRDGMNLVSYEFVACQGSKKGVLILSEFAGAAQSLGAGALLVNPWNITEVANSIVRALNMPTDEREKRFRHSYAHVTTHTSQDWAETFLSELNDTVVEAQLRTRQVPPILPTGVAIGHYLEAKNRLLILGFNATLTESVESSGSRCGDQIEEMELKLHPDLKVPLKALCHDKKTTVIVLSGSDRSVLDDNFGEYDMWLAAENGMFLRHTDGEWMTTMPEHLNMDWMDSVEPVFEYFTERTPRSCFEHRETSLVWNYKYAEVEFGRLQARDMLQHLWTGPISNIAVDVIQGSRSVEVRSVGVTKGAAIDRMLGEIIHTKSMVTPIDYVLCIGHFLRKDEDIYTFFEPDLPSEPVSSMRTKKPRVVKASSKNKQSGKPTSSSQKHGERQKVVDSSDPKASASILSSSTSQTNPQDVKVVDSSDPKAAARILSSSTSPTGWRNPQDVKGENYFSCAVGRKRTNARYLLNSSDDVVVFLKELAEACSHGSPGSNSNLRSHSCPASIVL